MDYTERLTINIFSELEKEISSENFLEKMELELKYITLFLFTFRNVLKVYDAKKRLPNF